MNDEMTPFPESISDEAAFVLSETLHWLALTCDEKYYSKIRRYMVTLDAAKPIDPNQPWMKKTQAK